MHGLRVYLKLRNGKWVLVNKKLEYASSHGKRKVVKRILAGEVVEEPPALKSAKSVLVPSSSVTKLISKLLDEESSSVVLVEPHDTTYYVVKAEEGLIRLVNRLVQELVQSKKASESREYA